MPLPDERNTTYAPGSQVLSADLNAIQDSIVGNHEAAEALEAEIHGERPLPLPASLGQSSSSRFTAGGTGEAPRWFSDGSANTFVDVPIPLRAGDRIAKLEVWIREGNEAGELARVRLDEVNQAAGTSTEKLDEKTSGTTGNIATLEWEGAGDSLPLVLEAGRLYRLHVRLDAHLTGQEIRFLGGEITYDRPKPE